MKKIKVIVASDNHFDHDILKSIERDNPDGDYFLHLGDSLLNNELLRPFQSVLGNNDFDMSLPRDRVIKIANHKIFMTHGHRYLGPGLNNLIQHAKDEGCDICLYGHTHRYQITYDKDILALNPGSCWYDRYGGKPSYAILYLYENGEIEVNKVDID